MSCRINYTYRFHFFRGEILINPLRKMLDHQNRFKMFCLLSKPRDTVPLNRPRWYSAAWQRASASATTAPTQRVTSTTTTFAPNDVNVISVSTLEWVKAHARAVENLYSIFVVVHLLNGVKKLRNFCAVFKIFRSFHSAQMIPFETKLLVSLRIF